MRVAIVEDSPVALEAVRRAVVGHTVVWIARDGDEAARLAKADLPDAILMDLIMPGIDGAAATARIMAESPCPILIVTSTVSGNYALVYAALGAGAIDAVTTPTISPDGRLSGGDALLAKLAGIDRKTRGSGEFRIPTLSDKPPKEPLTPPIIALGASTGGPQALAALLAEFPVDFPCAVLVAQHLDADFTKGLADWLAAQIRLPVSVAGRDEVPRAGRVHLAGRNDHLILNPFGRLGYTADPVETPFRPSVDVLFESLAGHAPPGAAALLTGMGRDGAAGLKTLRDAGWLTLSQDEASCAVYGMPAEAERLHAARHALPPAEIGKVLLHHARKAGKP